MSDGKKFDRKELLGTSYGVPDSGASYPGSSGLFLLGTLYEFRRKREYSGCLAVPLGIGFCFFLERFPLILLASLACFIYFIVWAWKPQAPDVMILVPESGEVVEREYCSPNEALKRLPDRGYLFMGSTGYTVPGSAARPTLKDKEGVLIQLEYPWKDSQVMTSVIEGKPVHLIGWIWVRTELDPKVVLDVVEVIRLASEDNG